MDTFGGYIWACSAPVIVFVWGQQRFGLSLPLLWQLVISSISRSNIAIFSRPYDGARRRFFARALA